MTENVTASFGTIIVGGGHAGAQAAASLLAAGYDAGIAVLSDEVALPYDRPSLSKGYLSGESGFDDILLRTADFWESPGIKLLRASALVAIEPDAHIVLTADGGRYGYGSLIWAAGGHARQLTVPGAELRGVHTVRGFADAERLRAEASGAANAVIIGGGYIGLEAAASLRGLGLSVTVVELEDRLLGRVTGAVVADYFIRRHREAGVEFRLGASVEGILGEDGRARAVQLGGGETLAADVIIVGVGLIPNIGPLESAGARIGNGVEVDEFCRTSLPEVYAVGDCASFPIPLYDGLRFRLESVQNAVDQAKVAAEAILGLERAYDPVPWFWSHQYDVRFQTVGLLTGYDELIVRGEPSANKFSVVYLRDSRVLAVDAVNSVKDFTQGKALVGTVYEGSRADLADASVSFKDLLRVGA